MATQSSILAWKIPWTEESGELQSMVLESVRYDLVIKQQEVLLAKAKRWEKLQCPPMEKLHLTSGKM